MRLAVSQIPPRFDTVVKISKPQHHITGCIFLFVVSSINKTLIICMFIKFLLLVRCKSRKRFPRRRNEKSLRTATLLDKGPVLMQLCS